MLYGKYRTVGTFDVRCQSAINININKYIYIYMYIYECSRREWEGREVLSVFFKLSHLSHVLAVNG